MCTLYTHPVCVKEFGVARIFRIQKTEPIKGCEPRLAHLFVRENVCMSVAVPPEQNCETIWHAPLSQQGSSVSAGREELHDLWRLFMWKKEPWENAFSSGLSSSTELHFKAHKLALSTQTGCVHVPGFRDVSWTPLAPVMWQLWQASKEKPSPGSVSLLARGLGTVSCAGPSGWACYVLLPRAWHTLDNSTECCTSGILSPTSKRLG